MSAEDLLDGDPSVPEVQSESSSELLCGLCNRTEDLHGKGQTHHAFSPSGDLVSLSDVGQRTGKGNPNAARPGSEGAGRDPVEHPGNPAPEVAPGPFPADPVLRMALITKGIISTDDLIDAENLISASSGQPISSIVRKRSVETSQVNEESPQVVKQRFGSQFPKDA